MSLQEIIFLLFAAVILVFSLLTITTRRILRAATFLLFVLISTAGLYFWLNYQFLAAVQVALYAGGIVVLIIFSILLTHHVEHKFDKPALANLLAGIGVAVVGAGLSIATILSFTFTPTSKSAVDLNVNEIGRQLVNTDRNGFSLPFEVISILLLAALIGAIVVAKKEKEPEKSEPEIK
jgi:NADH-quinone oxidoreductase subunit J